jgi:hypothetical protein
VRGGSDLTCLLDETTAGGESYGTYSVFGDSRGSLGTWDNICKCTQQDSGRGYGSSGLRRGAPGSEEDRGVPGAGEHLAERLRERDGAREDDGGGLQRGAAAGLWPSASG